MKEIIITKQTAGGRIDKLLIRYLDRANASFVYKMLRKKNIVLNDKKAQGDEILNDGDSIKLYLSDETITKFHTDRNHAGRKPQNSADPQKKADRNATSAPGSRNPSGSRPDGSSSGRRHSGPSFAEMIVYEDDNLIAFNKPAGLLSQKSAPGDHSVNEMLVSYLGRSDLFTPGISNRLDRNTSGLMLAGKNPAAVRELNNAVKDRLLSKLYICLVKGKITQDSTIEGYLIKNPVTNTVSIHKLAARTDELAAISGKDTEKAAYIKTKYTVLDSNDNMSLLLVDLITGRSHQIRAHLASIGHPIIGDSKYGDLAVNNDYAKKYHVDRQLLHAYKIEFESVNGILDYLNGKTIKAQLPSEFDEIMKGEKLCLRGSQED